MATGRLSQNLSWWWPPLTVGTKHIPFSLSATISFPLTQPQSPTHSNHHWSSYRPGWWWRSRTRPVPARGSEARLRSLPTPRRCSWCGPAARWWTPWFPSGSAAGGWSGCHYRRADNAGRRAHSAYTPHYMSSPGVLLYSGAGSTPGLPRSRSHWRLGGQALMGGLWRRKKEEQVDVIIRSS